MCGWGFRGLSRDTATQYLVVESLGARGWFQVLETAVGVVWESRSGFETAEATPGNDCLCSYSYGHEAVQPQANPTASLSHLLVCKWRGAYRGDLDRQGDHGAHYDMRSGHSVLFKLRRRVPENTQSEIQLNLGDPLFMDGLTQFQYENSTPCELYCPRVNLTFRWISQHIKSCA